MFNLIGNKKDSQGVAQLHSNPFQHECIDCISFFIRRHTFTKEFYMYASIDMKNKNTSAEHRIKDTDFNSLVLKVQEFINSLPKES